MHSVGCWEVSHVARLRPPNTEAAEAPMLGPFVLVANHSNFCDSVLLTHVNLNKRYLTKAVYSAIPVFGWTQSISGDITVDLNSPESRSASMQACVDAITKDHCSVVMSPL